MKLMFRLKIDRLVPTMHQTLKEGKEKKSIYIAPCYILCISQSAQAWITQFYLQIHHACLVINWLTYMFMMFCSRLS